MQDGAYSAPALPISKPSRRRAVGERWPGVYERTNRRGERVLEVDYYDEDGRRRWRTLPPDTTLKQALTARERLRVKRADGERFAPARIPSLGEFFDSWLTEQDLRGRTREKYVWAFKHHVKPKLGRRKLNVIDVEDVAALVRALKAKGLAPASIASILSPLSRVLAAAARRKLRTGNPVRELERDERPRGETRSRSVLAALEVAKLVASAPREHRALVAVLAWAGLRVSEALALTWADIDIDSRVIHVEAQLERRTGARVRLKTKRSRRDVVMSDELAGTLAAHKLARPKTLKTDDSLVFTTRTGKPLDHRAVARRAIDPAVKAAKITAKVTPHSLRHGFGSLLHDAGVPIAQISALLGHADEAFTYRTYVHAVHREDEVKRMRAWMRSAFHHEPVAVAVEQV
jgi:integrase